MANSDFEKDAALARREGLKLFYDVFKHLTTLSSGSIVLIVAFAGKVGSQSTASKPLIGISFLAFLISSVASVSVMLATARTVRRDDTLDQLPGVVGNVGYYLAVVSFAIGVAALTTYGYKNL